MIPANSPYYTEARLPNMMLPKPGFAPSKSIPPVLRPVWDALQAGEIRKARRLADAAAAEDGVSPDIQAALDAAIGAIEMHLGRLSSAETFAMRSLDSRAEQTLARLILTQVRTDLHDYAGAYAVLTDWNGSPDGAMPWDEPVSPEQLQVMRAALAWRLRRWELVAEHLDLAYPSGIETMPDWLLEDFFRLALYRNQPQDAAAAAALLIRKRPVESADMLLQTLVQQGWTEQALPLYRSAFSDDPLSGLLRRRLVALCLREGAVEEARVLTRTSPLEITRRISRHAANRPVD